MDYGHGGVVKSLIIFGVSPVGVDPGKSSFDNPSFWQYLKSVQFIPFYNLKVYLELFPYFFYQLPPISAICKYFGDLLTVPEHFGDYRDCPIPVLDRCPLDCYCLHQPKCVHDDVPFDSLYLLSRVIAPVLTAHKRRFYRLGIDYTNCGLFFLPCFSLVFSTRLSCITSKSPFFFHLSK